MRRSLIWIMAASPLPAMASDTPVRIREGQSFVTAREVLLQESWRSILMHAVGGDQEESRTSALLKRASAFLRPSPAVLVASRRWVYLTAYGPCDPAALHFNRLLQ